MIDQVHITIQKQDNVYVLRIEHASIFADDVCGELRDLMMQFVEQIPSPRIVVDMSQVQELGSRFLGALIMVRKAADKRSGKMLLARMTSQVTMSFRVAGLNKTMRSLAKLEDAVAELNKA